MLYAFVHEALYVSVGCVMCAYVSLCVLLAKAGGRILVWDSERFLFSCGPRILSPIVCYNLSILSEILKVWINQLRL